MDTSAHVVADMSAIMNPENIKPGINLKELEQKLINNGFMSKATQDPVNKFSEELDTAARALGINFNKPEYNKSVDTTESTQPALQFTTTESDSESESETESSPLFTAPDIIRSNDMLERTNEQQRKQYVRDVLGSGNEQDAVSFEKNRNEDMKCSMLVQIGSLLDDLKVYGVNTENIPHVDKDSSYDDITLALRMLRHKNDYMRHCTFANEIMLFGAYVAEDLFNGERLWFGRKPNLQGWHTIVQSKLQRMQHDAGEVVSGFIQDNNIGPIIRLLMELIPSMILHSKKQQSPQFNDSLMAAQANNIRSV